MSNEPTPANLFEVAALPSKPHLQLMGVADRGVPTRERIHLKVHRPVILVEYIVMIYWGRQTTILDQGQLVPILVHVDVTGIQVAR